MENPNTNKNKIDHNKAYFSDAAKAMLEENNAATFSRNTLLKEDEVKVIPGAQRIDMTAEKENSDVKIYGWVDENKNFYWWSNRKTAALLNGYSANGSSGIFSNLPDIISIDLSGIDTNNVTNMEAMFQNDSKLKDVNVELLDTSCATTMEKMFAGCASLESLDLTTFDVSHVVNFGHMFHNMDALQKLDISGWDMSAYTCKSEKKYVPGTEMLCYAMFEGAGYKAKQLHVIANEVIFPESATGMFEGNYMSQIDLNRVDLSHTISMESCFYSSRRLTKIHIDNATNVYRLMTVKLCFSACNNLQDIVLSGFDTSNNLLHVGAFVYGDTEIRSVKHDLNLQKAKDLKDISMGYFFNGTFANGAWTEKPKQSTSNESART